jgi:Domain of unknown function (DUF4124)
MSLKSCQLGLVLAAVMAAPAALAGPGILKCVDRAGHVTLTDQPCAPGSTGERVAVQEGYSGASGSTGSGGPADELPAARARPGVEHERARSPLAKQHRWRPAPAARKAPMARDAATLKAARAQLLLKDGGRTRPGRIAHLD